MFNTTNTSEPTNYEFGKSKQLKMADKFGKCSQKLVGITIFGVATIILQLLQELFD